MPPLEGDEEEVKEGTVLKIWTPNKLLTRFPVLLVQINSGNNLYKLKMEIRQILYLCITKIESLKHFATIESSHYNNDNTYLRQQPCNNNKTKNYSFDNNLKREINFIKKHIELLVENAIKNKIR